MSKAKWTQAEDERLLAGIARGELVRDIARELGRSLRAAYMRTDMLKRIAERREGRKRGDAQVSAAMRAWRRQRGMSQSQLAAASGVAQQQISRIEVGWSQPRAETLDRLRVAMGMPLDFLLQHIGEVAS